MQGSKIWWHVFWLGKNEDIERIQKKKNCYLIFQLKTLFQLKNISTVPENIYNKTSRIETQEKCEICSKFTITLLGCDIYSDFRIVLDNF